MKFQEINHIIDDQGGILDKDFSTLKKFRFPLCHKGAERIIQKTLEIPYETPLSLADLRRAVLISYLTPLRQTVGSCFATAPAILIQQNREAFFADLLELLSTGRLKRTFQGDEYTVPLCLSTDCTLQKAWEYTLAGFAEMKAGYARYSLYIGLGLDPRVPGGVGETLLRFYEERLQVANQTLIESQSEYERAFNEMKASESLARQSEHYKSEFLSRLNSFEIAEKKRNNAHAFAEKISKMFSVHIKKYDFFIQLYFQEIYDPVLVHKVDLLEHDSPAGFRLVYKHGRADSSVWTSIENGESYIACLTDFFTLTETLIQDEFESDEEKKAVEAATSEIIRHVRHDSFLKFSIKESGKWNRTPWAYISGGTMASLLKTYFRIEGDLVKEERWVEDETDLCVFILDVLKGISPKSPLLMESPNHAFILHPEWEPFSKGWKDRGFSYTWVRDQILVPGKQFYHHLSFSRDQQKSLFAKAGISYPLESKMSYETFRDIILSSGIQKPEEFLFSQAALHAPLIRFADTNWPEFDFAFLVCPITFNLKLWRIHKSRFEGHPMREWASLFPSRRDLTWVIYTNPTQYTPHG